MARIGYFRVSTSDQSIEAQRHALGGSFDCEFSDEGVSGSILAADRPGFAEMLRYARAGDTIAVYSVDRLGRDALDIQGTVRGLINKGVTVDILGLGPIAKGVGELILAVLAQMAEMERNRIRDRCEAGRSVARASLEATGRTHRGKASLGRPVSHDAATVRDWRKANAASIAATAAHFGIGTTTVKRYCV